MTHLSNEKLAELRQYIRQARKGETELEQRLASMVLVLELELLVEKEARRRVSPAPVLRAVEAQS